MTNLIAHLESFLGEICGGNNGDATTPPGVQVAWFGPDVPFRGATTLTTLGLSRQHLSGGSGPHQELLLHLRTEPLPENAAGVLFQLAGEMIRKGWALDRCDVIGPRGPLFDGSAMSALYATLPLYMPEEFEVCEEPDRVISMIQLVPITAGEAAFGRARGGQAFEERLVAQDADLTDVDRASVVEPDVP
jgi:hypothetical protein